MSESAHEKYLRGEPLTTELAAVRDGRDVPLSGDARPAAPAIENPERRLSSSERGMLRELRLHEGWPVYQRLLEKTFHLLKKGAITISEIDPLGNKEHLAKQWAYLAMYQQARRDAEEAMKLETREDGETE